MNEIYIIVEKEFLNGGVYKTDLLTKELKEKCKQDENYIIKGSDGKQLIFDFTTELFGWVELDFYE